MKFNFQNGSGSNPLEIEATKLKEKLDKGEDLFILDVRTPEEYEAWRLSYDRYQKTPLIPVDKLFASQTFVDEQLPKDKEIVTLCAHGNRSMMAAQMLSRLGYKVKSVRGGMAAWNQIYDIVELPLAEMTDTKDIRVWQLRRVSKGCMGYVIASGNKATVIDPTSDLENSISRLVEENNLDVINVIDTHMHADHISGLSALVAKTGAHGFIGQMEGYQPHPDVDIKAQYLIDGQEIPVGNGINLRAIHTPGHTEGSMTLELSSTKQDEKLTFLFTGDTIFVNGVGRPDLRDKASEFASNLYNTYQTKILSYPDSTVVLPAHFDPSSVAIKHGELISGTVGMLKENIKLLQLPKDKFVEFMVSSVPQRPMNYKMILQINRQLIPSDQINIGDLEAGPNSCAVRM